MAPLSPSQKNELHSILRRVLCGDVVTVNKTYILRLLNRERDRSEAWDELLSIYEDVGGDPDKLFGVDMNNQITLSVSEFWSVKKWAGRE